ncbi:PSP1 C-terminal conserved region-domain-containing protein [Phascolomyces articulosus]|uniref:PSP1 C-terminal conserved region-domain-containing protein n=1 Tax=Phascolomyces articulosus TaxID=60185 RepID=A0AAD5PE16_9FUNG|nr:PSP1 C-terminal conserved region-domain-containing protein [Phascolomyces articulosus]
MAALLPSYILSDTGSESSLASSPTTPISESWLDDKASPSIDLDFIDLDDTTATTTMESNKKKSTDTTTIPLLLPSKATPLPLPHSSWTMTSPACTTLNTTSAATPPPPTTFWSSTIWNTTPSTSPPKTTTSPTQRRRQSMMHYHPQQDHNRTLLLHQHPSRRRQSDFMMGDGPRRFSTSSSGSSSDKKLWRTDDFLLEQPISSSRFPTPITTATTQQKNELSPELLQHIDDYFSPMGMMGINTMIRSSPSPPPPCSLSSSLSTTTTTLSSSPTSFHHPPTFPSSSAAATIGGDDTFHMGKGIPLHQLLPTTPIFMVELTQGTGKPEMFYMEKEKQEDNTEEDEKDMIHMDDLVIVEADRGHDLGKVVQMNMSVQDVLSDNNHGQTIRRLYRRATEAEIATLPAKTHDEAKALLVCQSKIREKGLPMQVVSAEYQWDRRKLTFHFVAEERVDFRELVRELFKLYKTRIWMCAAKHPHRTD